MRTAACVSRLGLFILAGGLFLPPEAECIVRRHDVDDQLYRDFGAEFPSVGRVLSSSSLGSGVLIHSRWVLTAAHLQNGSAPDTVDMGDSLYNVEEFITHPDWNGDVRDGNDLALARLAEPVFDVMPSDWYTGSDELNRIGVSVGFGRTGTGLTGQSQSAGVKRAAETMIESVGSGSPFTPPHPPDDTLEYVFYSPEDNDVRPLEGMAAQGDSGGPVFIDFGDGFLIAGIHSFLWNVDEGDLATYGDAVVSTRVAAYDDWIMASIPEPRFSGVLGGSLALALVLLARRRLKK